MKILSSIQVGKTIPLSSNSMPDEDLSEEATILSPNWDSIDTDRLLHRSKSDPLDKRLKIATNKMKLGYSLRQNEKNHDSETRFVNFIDDFRNLSDDCLNARFVEKDLHGRLSESLMCLESGHRLSNSEKGSLLSPLPWWQGDKMTPFPQIREYRKSLSVRLGSLKWSLDLVMVVKSRSTSKSRLADKSGGRSSSNLLRKKVFCTHGKENILRTQSCIDLLRVSVNS